MANHAYFDELPFFETTSKRRRAYPFEAQGKRGVRIVHGDKLPAKLDRNDLKKCCLKKGCF